MLSDADLDLLRDRLLAAEYTLDPVLARVGPAGRAGLGRNSTVPARDALGDPGGDDAQAVLIRLWVLQDAVAAAAVSAAVGDDLLAALLAARLLEPDADATVRAVAPIRPYGAEAGPTSAAVAGWICHDRLPNLDGRPEPLRGDHVLGASPASTTLAQLTVRRPVGAALDLGTGCGVQSLHLAAHARRVVATDLTPRALDLARVSLRLSGADADLRLGSLYEPVAGETFDLIVSNPPYVMAPPAGAGERLTYREGALPGDDLVRRVVVDGARHLAPEGTMQVLCNWAITAGEPWPERLAGWLRPTGCDALVIERERLDPYEYVEMWLADAGLDRSPAHAERYRAWLDYLAGLGIVGVGLGWVSLRNAGRERPDLRLEEWPYDVHQPLGDAFAAQHRAVDLAACDDAALRATRWRVHPGVVQETMGRPGAADPEHVVLRQSFGLARAVEVDTGLAALVGACDGDLTAAEIVAAIARLLEVDAGALTADLTPRLRALVADGYLTD